MYEKKLKNFKNMIDIAGTLCYYVIGKESRVSALTRHKRVTMVQYLINNPREKCVIYEYVEWIIDYPLFLLFEMDKCI